LKVLVALVSLSSVAMAIPVTVQDLGVSPGRTVAIEVDGFYSGQTHAGVVNLLVGGVEMDGFCIDPFHFSSSTPLQYNWVPLTQAPKPPGTMDSNQALLISALWAIAYNPAIGADAAAGLQIAIWEIIGGDDFTLLSSNDYGATALIAQATTYNGPLPNLIGLTGPGQDYVVATPASVPDGGHTVLLLGVSLIVAGFLGHRFGTAA
jgi:hypothetical protein